MSTGGLESEWDDYLAVIREDAHQLLAWSYADTRPMLVQAKDEYELTGLLADGMNARIDSLSTPDKFLVYSVHNEKPTSPSGELGKKRPKLDIQIERGGSRPRRYFTFEAKRLRDDKDSKVSDSLREYLGPNGIGRFVSGYYGKESLESVMLGCIQAHDAEFWFTQVEAEFASDAQNGGHTYACTRPLRYAKVINDFPDERVSEHTRSAGDSIQIFHLFVDCQ